MSWDPHEPSAKAWHSPCIVDQHALLNHVTVIIGSIQLIRRTIPDDAPNHLIACLDRAERAAWKVARGQKDDESSTP